MKVLLHARFGHDVMLALAKKHDVDVLVTQTIGELERVAMVSNKTSPTSSRAGHSRAK